MVDVTGDDDSTALPAQRAIGSDHLTQRAGSSNGTNLSKPKGPAVRIKSASNGWAVAICLGSLTWPVASLWARLCERMDLWSETK